MAIGRRCDLGCETWPDEPLYAKCLECGEPTTRYRNVHPIDHEEAQSRLLHQQFEMYYERYCAQRGVPADGPLPVLEEADPVVV